MEKLSEELEVGPLTLKDIKVEKQSNESYKITFKNGKEKQGLSLEEVLVTCQASMQIDFLGIKDGLQKTDARERKLS